MTQEIASKKIPKYFRLSESVVKKLEECAAATGEDMTSILERAIELHVKDVAMAIVKEKENQIDRIKYTYQDTKLSPAQQKEAERFQREQHEEQLSKEGKTSILKSALPSHVKRRQKK